jgi:hypothetical protein
MSRATYFQNGTGAASWSSRPCSNGRCAISYIHPDASIFFTMKPRNFVLLFAALLLCPLLANATLVVSVDQPTITGSKAVVKLVMKNTFNEKVESARAVVFLLDDQGKMVGQSTKWVIGGNPSKPGLASGGTNVFHFVVQGKKPFTTTNLTAKVSFSRVVLESGKLADERKDVTVQAVQP